MLKLCRFLKIIRCQMPVKRKICWMLVLQILTGIIIYLGVTIFRPKLDYGMVLFQDASLLSKTTVLSIQSRTFKPRTKSVWEKIPMKSNREPLIEILIKSNHTNNILEESISKKLKAQIQNLITAVTIEGKITRQYTFENYNAQKPFIFYLPDDKKQYFVTNNNNVSCFKFGLDSEKLIDGYAGCICKANWHGMDCSIPEVVWASKLPEGSVTQLRNNPRRIINGFNINHEFDFLEARLNELYSVVDVFIICESNFSAYGSPKPLRLLEKLKQGYLKEFQDKIVYVFLDHFPEGGEKDGWIADSYLRTFLAQVGLQQIANIRQDDIFVLTDADEIPMKEALLFLKMYDGYTEPIQFNLRWSFYGFFWKKMDKTTMVSAACTTAMLKYVYNNDAIRIRRNDYMRDVNRVSSYMRIGGRIQEWYLGTINHPAGWHCSWCYVPEGIRLKLISAQNGDFPRWGDFEEKRDLSYIRNLIKFGLWFDDSKLVENMTSIEQDPYFAPKYMLDHISQFGYLLKNPYV